MSFSSVWSILTDFLWAFRILWPLFVIAAVILLFRIFFEVLLPTEFHRWQTKRRFRKGEAWRSDRSLLHWLQSMKPAEFEDYTADLFRRMGYRAEAVGGTSDGGIDVIATKDGVKHYIQCKKYITSEVGVGAMRDFYGALADHLIDGKGYFITTNRFTHEAEQFASDKPIELVDGFRLIKYIRASGAPAGPQDSQVAASICPLCGSNLVKRHGKFGEFYGCSSFPKCKFTKGR